MKRKYAIALASLICVFLSVLFFNYFFAYRYTHSILEQDARNNGVNVYAYYQHLLNPRCLVFDLQSVDPNKSMMDVTRFFLQFAERLKDENFDKVILAHKGKNKFYVNGAYFKTLGLEYETENPIYTIRTMPEHLHLMDGTPAFVKWTGGLLGVSTQQMKDFKDFHMHWYMKAMVNK